MAGTILSDDQKAACFPMFKVPSGDTVAIKIRDRHEIVTLDESWFDHMIDHELTSIPPHGKVPDLERVRLQSNT
jgi:hypothetical protein